MQTKNTSKNSENIKKKKRKWRILIWVIDSLLFTLLLLVILIPTLVSTKKGNQIILDQINKHIEGITDFSSLSMSWRKGIRINDLKFNDPAGQIFLFIKQLSTRPHYLSLLTKTPAFGATLIDQPQIEINLKAPQPKTISEKNTTAPLLPIKQIDLTVNNGALKVTDALGQTANLSQLHSTLNLRPAGQQTSFAINTNLSEGDKSTVTTIGQITPDKKTGWSLEGLSGNVKVECNDLDIETLGPLFAIAGIDFQAKGIVSANLNTQLEDGRVESLTSTVDGRNINITGDILKGDRLQTKTLDINAKLARRENMLNIENLIVNADWLKAQITGSVPTNLESLNSVLNSSSEFTADFECQLGTVLSQMPNTFAVKKGTNVTSGLLKGSVNTSTLAGKRNITGQATLTGLAGIVDGKNIAVSEPVSITTQISADKGVARFDKLNVSAAFAQINCSGTTEALQYTAQSDLSKLQAELGQFIDFGGYNIAGNISQQGSLTFDKDKINFVGSSEVKQFALASDKIRAYEPSADIKFDMQLRQKEGILTINYLNTDANVGKINIKDSVVALNKPEQNQSKLNISAKTVNLEKLRPFAALFTDLPKETTLAGIADLDISVTAKNDTYNFKTDNTKVSKLKVTYPGQQKPFEQDPVTLIADGSVTLTNKTHPINSLNWQLTSPQIKISGKIAQKVQGNSGSLEGQAKLEYDWSSAGPLASIFLPSELKIQGKRKDTINFSSTYPADKPDQLLPNLNADITTGFDKAEYSGLTMGKVETSVKAEKGLLKIEPVSTTLNNGKFNFAAQADLKGKPSMLKTPQPAKMIDGFEINDEMAKQFLPFFNPIFSNAVNVSGKANLSCDKFAVPIYAGKKEDIDIAGTLSVDNLKLQSGLLDTVCSLLGISAAGQTITVRPTKFEITKGLISYEDMQVDVGSYPVNFKGAIGLDKSLNMEVTLPITIKGAAATVDTASAERFTLPLTGTIDRPNLDTKKFIEIQAKKILEQQLQDILKGKLKTKTDGQTEQKDDSGKSLEDALEKILKDQLGKIVE